MPGATETLTAGGALLARLKAIGVEYIFANSGTDFPPIIEGLAEAAAKGVALPEALVMPHESAAMGMAHGYYLATGRTQAVIAHTNVGLANCAIGAINAAVEHVPVLVFSGRTPTTEKDRFGGRTVPIGWGQEMRDQTALVREACKWDYELRFPEQALEIADRAHAIANSTPRGPVYVSLPREVLCQPAPAEGLDAPPLMALPWRARGRRDRGGGAHPGRCGAPGDLRPAWGGSAEAFAALAELAEDWGIPVCQYWALALALPTGHAMAAAADPGPLIARADAILVLDALAPWSPEVHRPAPGCRVVQMGQDPLGVADPGAQLPLGPVDPLRSRRQHPGAEGGDGRARGGAGGGLRARRAAVAAENAAARRAALAAAEAGGDGAMTKEWVSLCLSRAVAGAEAVILSELGCPLGADDARAPSRLVSGAACRRARLVVPGGARACSSRTAGG